MGHFSAFFSRIHAYFSNSSSHIARSKKVGFLLCLSKFKVRDGTKLVPFTNRDKLVKYDVSQKGGICQRPLYFWLILARTRCWTSFAPEKEKRSLELAVFLSRIQGKKKREVERERKRELFHPLLSGNGARYLALTSVRSHARYQLQDTYSIGEQNTMAAIEWLNNMPL